MKNVLLTINPEKEVERVVAFLKKTFAEQKVEHVVLGLSGGVDSATSYFLLRNALPKEYIHVVHLPYNKEDPEAKNLLSSLDIPEDNKHVISIKEAVDAATTELAANDPVRKGNIMARMRMIFLFDMAKRLDALVCGTENRSEYLLGYYTRFGDEASDIEPLQSFYKMQIYQLAEHLGVPDQIRAKQPSAGLWSEQTDEKEFGFTYEEADAVIHLHFDKHLSPSEIERKGFINAKTILTFAEKNKFKHLTPYTL